MFRPLLDIQWGIRFSMLHGLPKANNLINHSPNRTCIKIQNKIFEKYFNFKPHVEPEGWCVCTVHFFHLFFHCVFLKDDIVHNKSLPLVPKVTAEIFWIHNGSHGDLWFISGLLKIQIPGGWLLETALVTVCDTESFHMGYDSDSRYKLSECNWILEYPADV